MRYRWRTTLRLLRSTGSAMITAAFRRLPLVVALMVLAAACSGGSPSEAEIEDSGRPGRPVDSGPFDDVADAGSGDTANDADGSGAPSDAADDSAVDTAVDTAVDVDDPLDVATDSDTAPDGAPDTTTDTVDPDTAPDTAPDTGPDAAADTTSDTGPDTTDPDASYTPLDPGLSVPPGSAEPCTNIASLSECSGIAVCRFFAAEEGRCESCVECGNLFSPCSTSADCDILFQCYDGACTNFCPLEFPQTCGNPDDCIDVGHPTHGICRPGF